MNTRRNRVVNKQWLVLGTLSLSVAMLSGCASRTGSSESVAGQAPVIAPQTVQVEQTHQVQPGDTLYAIARKTGIDWKAIASLNGIQPPYTIRVGQVLRLGQAAQVLQPALPAVVASPSPVLPVASLEPVQPVVVTAPASVSAPPVAAPVSAPESAVSSTPAPTPSQIMSLPPVVNWRWPSDGKVIRAFNPQNPTNPNKGIDIGGELGQPVVAAAAGEVVYAGSGLQGLGQLVLIRHNKTEVTAYGHNQRLLVQEGQTVRAGEKIAEMGSSGTDRVKLHFEVRKDGKPVDPLQLLPRS